MNCGLTLLQNELIPSGVACGADHCAPCAHYESSLPKMLGNDSSNKKCSRQALKLISRNHSGVLTYPAIMARSLHKEDINRW
jgi:hypothetical protein